jgi:hypothetical protein
MTFSSVRPRVQYEELVVGFDCKCQFTHVSSSDFQSENFVESGLVLPPGRMFTVIMVGGQKTYEDLDREKRDERLFRFIGHFKSNQR